MTEKNLVEETLLQIQNLEDVINENAKEILASTMKEEISELVKESMKQETEEEMEMKEQFEEEEEEESEEEEIDMEMDMEDEESDEEMEMDMEDMELDMDMDNEVTDLTDLEDTPENAEMIAQIFKNMKDSDEVTVVQDGDYTKLTDNEAETEYLIQTEGTEDELEESEEDDEYEYELEEGMDEFNESMKDSETELEESDEDAEENESVMYEIEIDTPTDELEEEEYEFELEEEDNESYNPMTEAKKSKKMETKEGMDLAATLKAYDYKYTPQLIEQALTGQVVNGVPMTSELLIDKARFGARLKYSAFADLFEKGYTVNDVFEPYQQVAAQLLERAPQDISYEKDLYRVPLEKKNEDGTPMTISQWSQELKSNSDYGWQYTANANRQISNVIRTLEQAFGKRS